MLSRRTLLRIFGISVSAGLAGCNALNDDNTDETTTQARTATPTSTPTTTLSPTTDGDPATAMSEPTDTITPREAEGSETPVFTPTPDGTVSEFGRAVALSEDAAIVLADSSGAYVFEDHGNWSPTAILNPDEVEDFGSYNMSAVMVNEEAILGGPNAGSGGAVFLFARGDDQWQQRHQFIPAQNRDHFGRSVAFDGDRVVIGDNNNPTMEQSWSGSAYVFKRDGTDWKQEAALGRDAEDLFGTSVAVAGDIVLVGAPYAEPDGQETGAVYVYEQAEGEWQRRTTLTSDNSVDDKRFGQSIALDGDTAVVGAPGNEGGSAYVFEQIDNGWTRRSRLTATDTDSPDDFGWSVAYTGGTAVIGAPNAGENGHAYVFSGADDWMETRKLVAEDPKENAEFGFGVAMHDMTTLVGSPVFREASPAYLFKL